MDLLDVVMTIGGSILSGGATGLLGTGLSFLSDHFKRKQDLEAQRMKYAHEKDMRAEDRLTIAAEYQGREQVAKIEGEAAEAVADAGAFAASYKLEPKRFADPKQAGRTIQFLWGVLDFWRGLIRPGMTTYLTVLTTVIYLQMAALLMKYGTEIPIATVEKIILLIVSTVLYLTTTCALWWFGTRNKQKPPAASL